jgi:PAS domain S-box-containing protein
MLPSSLRPEHLLAAILSSTEDGLLSFSLDGTIQSWSAGAEKLYGYSATEMTGQPVTVLLSIYDLSTYEDFLSSAKNGTCLRSSGRPTCTCA